MQKVGMCWMCCRPAMNTCSACRKMICNMCMDHESGMCRRCKKTAGGRELPPDGVMK